MFKKNFFSVGGIVVLVVSLYVLTVYKIPTVQLRELPLFHYQYVLSPLNTRFIQFGEKIELPTVVTRLYTSAYITVHITENIDLRRRKSDPLILASKRLAELDSWGKSIPVLPGDKKINVSHKNQIVKELMNMWQKNKPKLYFVSSYKNFNSWEASFARYFEIMEDTTKTVLSRSSKEDPSYELIRLKSYLDFHRRIMSEIINTKINSEIDREYFQKISDAICDHFESKMADYFVPYDKTKLIYSLKPIVSSREYGFYDISIDKSELLAKDPQISLYLNNKLLSPFSTPFLLNQGKKIVPPVLLFNDIKIDDSSKTLTIVTMNKNIINDQNVIDRYDPIYEKYYYFINIPSNEIYDGKYEIEYKSTLKKPAFFQLVKLPDDQLYDLEHSFSREILRTDSVLNEFIPPNTSIHPLTKLVTLSRDKSHLRFGIVSDNQLTPEEINTISINVSPLIDTEISIEKIDNIATKKMAVDYQKINDDYYIIKPQNSSINSQQYLTNSLPLGWKIQKIEEGKNTTLLHLIFWPKKTASVLFFLSLLYLSLQTIIRRFKPYIKNKLMALRLYKKNKFSIFTLFSQTALFLWKKSNSFLHNGRYILLIMLVGWIYTYIFLYTALSETTTIVLLMLWLITVLSFAVEARINFVIAFIILMTRLIFFNNPQIISEKLSIWAFLFLIFGVFQLTFERVFKFETQTTQYVISESLHLPIFAFISKSVTALANKIMYILFNVIIKSTTILIILLKRYLNTKPKTNKDRALNVVKIAVLVCVISFIMFTTFKFAIDINTQFTIARNKRLRQSLNPYINKIEPKLVYSATKVVIFGDNFEWKPPDHNPQLFSQYGEIKTDLWIDKKIVFTIPLHWKPGLYRLWIEKTILWNGSKITAKSEAQTIKLLPRGGAFTPDDDAYFEQLQHLEKETLQLNGYK